jgi:hypothetical protein
MQPNAFAGRAKRPDEKSLAFALGASQGLWKRLVADLHRDLKLEAEWHTSSVKLGWSLRLQCKRRNIVYLGPRDGWFLAAFALSDKALAAARKSSLPPDVLKKIAESKRYPEGTAVRIEVKKAEDLEVIKMLTRIKLEN